MKKPSLRFRQVFEHPTHFKVVKPIGNPLIIAKQGLSPSLQGRLRKFAEGGEVRGYNDGGLVTNPATNPAGEVVESNIPPIAMPVAATDSSGAIVETIGLKAPIVRIRPRYSAGLSQVGIQEQSTVPAMVEPTTSLVTTTARPDELEIPEPQIKPVAPQVTPKAKPIGGVPAMVIPQMSEEEKAAERAKAQRLISQDMLERIQVGEAQSDLATAYETESARLSQDIGKYNKIADDNRKIAAQADADLADMKNTSSYFSRLDTPSKIGTAISLALGAFAAGLGGIPNVALRLYEDAVDKDIEKQKRDANSLYNRLVQAGNTADHAEQMVRSISANAAANRIEAQSAKIASAKAQQGAAAAAASFREDAENRIRGIERDNLNKATQTFQARMSGEQLKLAKEAGVRQDVAQLLDAQRAQTEERRVGVEEAKAQTQLAKETREAAEKAQANTFYVGPIGVKTTDPTLKRTAQQQILGESDFIPAVAEAIRIIKENPNMAFMSAGQLRSDANKELRAALNTMLERYPKGERFGRPLNVTASTVVKSGLPSPDEFLANKLGDPTIALQHILDDAKARRRDALETYGGADPAGVDRALQYLEQKSAAPKKFGSGATG